MTLHRWPCLLITALALAIPARGAVRVTGAVFTHGAVDAVTVRVFARGEATFAARETLDKALVERRVAPGGSFAIEVSNATLPLRVEATAPGHVAAAITIVFPADVDLPAAWLEKGQRRVLHVVVGGKPATGATVWGQIGRAAVTEAARRWTPCVPISAVDADGTLALFAGTRDVIRAWGRGNDGRWGRVVESAPDLGMQPLALDATPVAVRVVDPRAKPVAGIRVADAHGPAGSAAVTDEEGRATVMVGPGKTWSIVALDGSLLGRTLRTGSAPAAGVVVTAEPFAPLEVSWTGAQPAVALAPSWFPEALTGDAPLLVAGGRARLPFWGTRGWLLAFAPGMEVVQADVEDPRQPLVVRLLAAVTVTGLITDAADTALPGVPVWSLTPPEWMRSSRMRTRATRAMMRVSSLPVGVSGRNGQFVVLGLPSGPLGFEARLDGYPPTASPDLDAKAGSTHRITLKIAPGRTVTLTTVDHDGRPIAGVSAEAFADSSGDGSGVTTIVRMAGFSGGDTPVATATSDDEGHTRLPGVPAGGVRVELSRSGYARLWANGTVTEAGLDLGEQVLEPGSDVAGRVVDDDGNGVADADVFVDTLGLGRTLRPDARSDPQGYFLIADQASSGALALSARGEGFASAAPTRVTLPTDGPITIHVSRERALTGRVADRETGEAVSGATVSASKRIERSLGGRAQFSVGHFIGSSEADDAGHFELDGLQPGEIEVAVAAPGYRNRAMSVEIPRDGELDPVTILIERGLVIRGQVVDTHGAPAGGVEVDAMGAETGGVAMPRVDSRAGARTGPDGRFVLDGLAPGRYQVTATGEQGERARDLADAGADDVVLRLEAPGRLQGTVRTTDGDVPARCRVQAFGPSGGNGETNTDSSGSFTIEDLAPGTYSVLARAEGYAMTSKHVTVESGGTATVELELQAGATVNGRVLGLSPEELERCRIMGGGAMAQPNGDGRFALRGVHTGRVKVTASVFPDGRERSAAVDVRDGSDPEEVEIDFGGGLSLSGSVRRAGRPAVGMGVAATNAAGPGQSAMTTTDESGHYTLTGLEPGEIDVSVQDSGGRTLVARRASLTTDTRLDLEVPGGSLGGRVVATTDESPIMGARVVAELPGATPLLRDALSDDTGAFQLSDLPDGSYRVRATAPGYSPDESTATIDAGSGPDLTLRLDDADALELLVHEPDGRVPDRVFLLPMRNGRVEDILWVPVDRRGRALVTSLPPGEATVLVTGVGSALARVMVPSRGNVVQLLPTGHLTMVAPDASEGLTARFRIVAANGTIVPVGPWQGPARDGWIEASAGRAGLSLPVGEYMVEAILADGAHRTATATVTPAGNAAVTF